MRRLLVLLAVGLVAAAACSPDAGTSEQSGRSGRSGRSGFAVPDELPLGDGKLTDHPQRGSLWLCRDPDPLAPGATGSTPWIDGSTWHPRDKPSVQGEVRWPEARFEAKVETRAGGNGEVRKLSGNQLPVGTPTGTFPIATSDPASAYDRNPNAIRAGVIDMTIPIADASPQDALCVGFGAIGVLTDGSLLYNAVDARGRDAPAHEVTDRCDGHPDGRGIYHHHNVPACLAGKAEPGEPLLVGWAFDGHGIFVELDEDGSMPTNDDLDSCHGRKSEVPMDGTTASRYHYVVTAEYPYTIGCFVAQPADLNTESTIGPMTRTP